MGGGKTAFMTFLAYIDHLRNKKIVANYDIKFDNVYMDYEDFTLLPEEVQDCTLLWDEVQIGASSRSPFSLTNKEINRFVTQLRKRNIVLYYTTQNFKFIDVDLRRQTRYLIAIKELPSEEGTKLFYIEVTDRQDYTVNPFGSIINSFEWDATEFFKMNLYNTDELISFSKEETVNGSKESNDTK